MDLFKGKGKTFRKNSLLSAEMEFAGFSLISARDYNMFKPKGMVMTPLKILVAATLILSLGACSGMDTKTQRTLSGGAIGSAGGAAITALAGGSLVTGALVGGAAGAAVGYLTSENELKVGN